jgi:hypothetical protein
MLNLKFALKPLLIAGAAVFTVLAAPIAADYFVPDSPIVAQARAEEDGGGGAGADKKGGHHGARPADKGGPKWEPGSQPWPEGKGPPPDSDYWSGDGRPPRYGGDPDKMGKPEAGSQGGAPQWAAQELVDIGRLNVARSPESVLLSAEATAIAEMDAAAVTEFYDKAVAILVAYQDQDLTEDEKATLMAQLTELLYAAGDYRVDSPVANIAFYNDIMEDGVVYAADGSTVLFQADTVEELQAYAAIFLGGAADKTKPVLTETVHAVDIILELEAPTAIGETPVNLDETQDAAVADVSAFAQEAIVYVHDNPLE